MPFQDGIAPKIEEDATVGMKNMLYKSYEETLQQLYSRPKKCIAAEVVYFEGVSVLHMMSINHTR